jgi:hypothetical protein
MKEKILKKFFEGRATADDLARDLKGAVKQLSKTESVVRIEAMDSEFRVTRPMLVALCDAVLTGAVPAEELATVGFALESSDNFEWDGDEDELLADIIADWSCPEINFPLTSENVARCRRWLTGAEDYPQRPSSPTQSEPPRRVISIRRRT